MNPRILRLVFNQLVFTIMLAWGFAVSPSFATTYYVSSSLGSDLNDCLTGNPCKTIHKANSVMAGLADGEHSILFSRGDTWTLGGGEATALVLTVSGTSDDARVTIGAYGSGDLPKFNGGGSVGGQIFNTGESWITIENLEVYNSSASGIATNSTSSALQGIIVQDCTVYNTASGRHNVIFRNTVSQGRITNIIVRRNTIYNGGWDGIKICDGVTYFYVYDNTVYNIAHIGIDNYNISTSIEDRYGWIYGNTLYNNQMDIQVMGASDVEVYDNDIYDGGEGSGATGAIKVAYQAPNQPTNVIVRNNRIWDQDADSTVAYAIAIMNTVNTKVYNNTIYSCINTIYDYNNTNQDIRNNLAYANTSDTAALRNYGSDPSFVDAAGDNFTLQSGSPAIDQGIDVGLPYNGVAPDLGAYEYVPGGDVDPPDPPTGLNIISDP